MTETVNSEFGVNIWWTCPEFVMSGEKAQEIFDANGFESETDLPLPSRRNVVSRAAYSFQDRRSKDGRKVTEKAKDNGQCVVYGILGQTRKGDEEVAYDQGTTIRLDKESGRVEATGTLAEQFYEALRKYDDAVTDDDVRQFLRKVIKMCYGIAKRPSGGIYFVPQRFIGVIENAQKALDDLDIGAKLYVERVMNGEQERKIVWEAVENDIEGQIDATLKAVERIEKRASSVQSQSAKLDELNGLMDIYRQLLGQEAKYEELAERLEAASQTVAGKLSKLQAETAAKKTATAAKTGGASYKRSKITTSILPAVKEILAADGAMHYTELAEKLEAKGVELRATKTKTKAQWVAIQINDGVRNGEDGIAKLGKGVYGIA